MNQHFFNKISLAFSHLIILYRASLRVKHCNYLKYNRFLEKQ